MTNQFRVPERAAMPLRIRAAPAGEPTIGRRGGRRQASIPTVLARKGYWQPGRGRQSVDGTDFLGVCKANGKLTMADLDILYWLCERSEEPRRAGRTARGARRRRHGQALLEQAISRGRREGAASYERELAHAPSRDLVRADGRPRRRIARVRGRVEP